MYQSIWQEVFVPAAKASYPGCTRVRSMPGDPPFPLVEAPELARSLLFFTANSLSILAVDRPLVPIPIQVKDLQPTITADRFTSPVDPNALALRQLLALSTWENLELALNDDILELGPVMSEWLDLIQTLPEGTPVPAEVVVPFLIAKQLAQAEVLSHAQGNTLTGAMGIPPSIPDPLLTQLGAKP